MEKYLESQLVAKKDVKEAIGGQLYKRSFGMFTKAGNIKIRQM